MGLNCRLRSRIPDASKHQYLGVRILFVLLLIVQAQAVSAADSSMDDEIDFLLAEVASSDCIFVRNGKEHSASDATDHLQMKRRRGKRYFDTTEEFIDRIASKSSWSGKEYLIRCPGQATETAAEWFHRRLEKYRAQTLSSDG